MAQELNRVWGMVCEKDRYYYNEKKVDAVLAEKDAAIAKLNAENERLKKCEIWMKQHFYCEEVIACESAKNRRLKRALYKACANWARSERYTEATWHGDEHREELWANVQAKCRAKAEKYK